jgi:hypothetical protein
MRTEQRDDGWWITGVPDAPDCGPYETRKEADQNKRGLARFFRRGHDPEFVLGESEGKLWRKEMEEQFGKLRAASKLVLDELTDKHAEAKAAGVNLGRSRGLLRGILESLAHEDRRPVAVSAAKEACEEIQARAGEAFENGDEDFRDLLADNLRVLAPVVAALLPYIEEPDAEAA